MPTRDIPIMPSSNIKAVRYSDEDQTMEIDFNDGGTYKYHSVDSSVADGFSQADSTGKYFHNFVKNQHQYSKIG